MANKHDELNLYFDELLSEPQSGQDKDDSDFHNPAEKVPVATSAPVAQQSSVNNPEPVKPVADTPTHGDGQASFADHKFIPLQPTPLAAAAPVEAKTDVSAYEQHKQRLEKMLQQVNALDTGSSDTKTVTPEVVPDVKVAEAVDTETAVEYVPMPPLSSEWLENGRPHWAQEQFDVLLIEVNGLQLAVPLVALGQIQQLDEDLTPLFGQSDWFMGLQKTMTGNVKTVDTAKFVMPERYQQQHDYSFVVSINGLAWGLAVDRIHQPISIDPEAIRWRSNRSNRPWMAGTLKDHMCVLLDIPAMGEILQEQDKNHPQSTGG